MTSFLLSLLATSLLIISEASAAETPNSCLFVTLKASKELKEQQFVQYGVGWIFKKQGDEALYVLTPAHVVDSWDKFSAHCHDVKVSASLVGQSATLDLAVLKLETENEAFVPLFRMSENLKAPKEEHIQGGQVWAIYPNKESNPQRGSTPQVFWKNRSHHPLLGIERGIVLETSGVRPGFSGSPFYAYSRLRPFNSIPAGMITKTENNFHQAYAIPTFEIFEALPLLLEGKDPWREKNPDAPFIVDRLYLNDSNQLKSSRSLYFVYKNEPHNHYTTIREMCRNTLSSPVSQWQNVGGTGDAGNGGGTGDAGNGGGTGDAGNGSGEGSSPTFSGFDQLYSVYKKTNYCDYEGLIIPSDWTEVTSKNRILEAIKAPHSRRAISISDVFDAAIEYGPQFDEWIEEHGFFAEEEHGDYRVTLCRSDIFQGQPYLEESFGNGLYGALPGYHFSGSILSPISKEDYIEEGGYTESGGPIEAGIYCLSPDGPEDPDEVDEQIRIIFDDSLNNEIKPEMAALFSFGEYQGKGYALVGLKVGTCELKETVLRPNLWSLNIDFGKAKARLILSPDGSLVARLSIYDVDPSCTEGYDPQWLMNNSFTAE